MIDLDDLMLRRAEEQMRDGAWKRRDQGESSASPPATCVRCDGAVYQPTFRGVYGRRMCIACYKSGWLTKPCPRCDGVLHRKDFSKLSGIRGLCGRCREELRIERGQEEI